MHYLRFVAFLSFLTLCFTTQAIDPLYTAIGKANGLPSREIYDIFQDKVGFMWFATNEGLCRYDGTKTIKFATKNQGLKSGSEIQEDKYGRIWYMSFDGLAYYTSGDSLYRLEESGDSNPVYYRFAILNNHILLLRKNGIHIYNLSSLKQVKLVSLDGDLNYDVTRNDTAFAIINGSSVLLINEKGETTTLSIPKFTQNLPITIFSDSTFYSFQKTGTISCRRYMKEQIIQSQTISGINFIGCLEKCNQGFWVCSSSGAFQYSSTPNLKAERYFEDYFISAVYQDREGNYWFGTLNAGVLLVHDLNTLLTPLPFEGSAITVQNGVSMIGNQKGEVIRLNEDNTLSNTLFQIGITHKIKQIEFTGRNYIVLADKIYITDKKWNLSYSKQLAVKHVTRIDDKYYAYAASGMIGLFTSPERSRLEKNSEWDALFQQYFSEINSQAEIQYAIFKPNVRGTLVAYDSIHKIIYYSTSLGLIKVKPSGIEEVKYKNSIITAYSLLYHNQYTYILLNTGELLRTKDGENMESLTLLHNQGKLIPRSIRVSGNNLYISAETGLFCTSFSDFIFQKGVLTSDTYQIINSLDYENEILDYTIKDSQILILTSAGIVSKSLNQKPKPYSPTLVLHHITTGDQTFKIAENHHFPYYENDIKINYSILSFLSKGVYPLYYRINGGDWQKTETDSRSILFAALSPGKYIIEFRLGNDDTFGIQTITFSIFPPWWKSDIFYTLMAGIIILGSFLFYKMTTNAIHRRSALQLQALELENELFNSKLTSIRSQMNPHFFYNALNTVQSYIFMNERKNAITFLSKFAKLTRMILEMSGNEYLLLNEELDALKLYLELEKSRFGDAFNYEINVSEEINAELQKIPTMILQPYIENAIKHGLLHKSGEKKLLIAFVKIENGIRVIIEDNGIGRKRSAILNQNKMNKPSSFATNANERRITLLNKISNYNITVTFTDNTKINGEPSGTKVEIELLNKMNLL